MRLTLALLLCFFVVLPLMADIIQIGDGTQINQGLPWEPVRTYSYSQQVFYASDINFLGYVTSVSFQYTVSSANYLATNQEIKIWLGHTPRTHLDSWTPLDSLTLCYDGVLTAADFSGALPGQGWLTIELVTPFLYNATDNLLIAVDENSPGSGSTADDFLSTASTQVRGLFYGSMAENLDPANPPATGYYSRLFYPNIRLEMMVFSFIPYAPVPQDEATGVATDTNLQWESNATSFDLYLGTSPQSMTQMAQGLTQTLWNLPEPLQQLETYYWQVIAHDGGLDYPGQVWSFTTIGEGIGAPQNLYAYHSNDHVQLSWDAPASGTPVLYRVYRNGLFLATSETLEYQDFEVTAGFTYYYYVKAESSQGELSQQSNTVTVHVPDDIPNLIVQQGFEACPPFTQDVSGWQNLDLDGFPTWTWTSTDFPNEGSALGWLSFFPAQTTPPLTTVSTHSGAGMLVSISSMTPPNSDWLISPRINLGTTPSLTFWARSHTADYGLERLKVLLSTTDSAPASFTALNSGSWLSVPAVWTEYSYDLSAWQGQNVYLAWQCVSWDAFALYLDDIVITGEGGSVPLGDELAPPLVFTAYPNPSSGAFTLSNPSKPLFDLEIYDIRGRKLFSRNSLITFRSDEYNLVLPSGVYFIRLTSQGMTFNRRLAIIK